MDLFYELKVRVGFPEAIIAFLQLIHAVVVQVPRIFFIFQSRTLPCKANRGLFSGFPFEQ